VKREGGGNIDIAANAADEIKHMYYYSYNFKLLPTERKKTDAVYHIQYNESTIKILSLIFEWKLTTSTHIAKFFGKEDRDKHIYAKLRRMWQGGLLESFKVFEGSYIAMPMYYTLSKQGLKLLQENGRGLYDKQLVRKYPDKETYLSLIFFKHECMVVELASLESQVANERLAIKFRGEAQSSAHDRRYDSNRDYNIEVFTPDYSVQYKIDEHVLPIMFTEYERTPKSKANMLRKLERYFLFFRWDERKDYILRIIFETEGMERAFWKVTLTAHDTNSTGSSVRNLRIITTNLSLITVSKDFLTEIYATRESLTYNRETKKLEIAVRIKMFRSL